MENYSEKNVEEKGKQESLKQRKNQNLQILQNRIHELEIDKQKKQREVRKEQYD